MVIPQQLSGHSVGQQPAALLFSFHRLLPSSQCQSLLLQLPLGLRVGLTPSSVGLQSLFQSVVPASAPVLDLARGEEEVVVPASFLALTHGEKEFHVDGVAVVGVAGVEVVAVVVMTAVEPSVPSVLVLLVK